MKSVRLRADRKRKAISLVRHWYRRNGRSLPWRGERDPYRIFLSEIMLQQTQVSRVLLTYPRFLQQYPTFQHLARAGASAVIRSWKGMGYNNRALRLRAAAQRIISDFGGTLPATVRELQSLPGVGPYTAHALACLVFGQRLPLVDTNISRILQRFFFRDSHSRLFTAADDWALAGKLLPQKDAAGWHQALMDLGSAVCTASSPHCDHCPLRALCRSAHNVHRPTNRRSSPEPGHQGIPNRIYRGRIVEVLRSLKRGESITLRALGQRILPGFSSRDHRWLESLLQSLERDGLIQRHGVRCSLPQ